LKPLLTGNRIFSSHLLTLLDFKNVLGYPSIHNSIQKVTANAILQRGSSMKVPQGWILIATQLYLTSISARSRKYVHREYLIDIRT
jgi:hypothetical protein